MAGDRGGTVAVDSSALVRRYVTDPHRVLVLDTMARAETWCASALVRPEVRIPVFVLVIASTVTVIDLGMNAWFHDLHGILGIFIPLIVTNCVIIGRAESFASRNSVDRAALDGLAMGIGFTLVLVALGGMRELIGQGTLFSQAHLMFGEFGTGLTITVLDEYRGFLLAILPPGAFIGLGLLIAMMNVINARRAERAARIAVPAPRPAEA